MTFGINDTPYSVIMLSVVAPIASGQCYKKFTTVNYTRSKIIYGLDCMHAIVYCAGVRDFATAISYTSNINCKQSPK
jgi:hypothetical protein